VDNQSWGFFFLQANRSAPAGGEGDERSVVVQLQPALFDRALVVGQIDCGGVPGWYLDNFYRIFGGWKSASVGK
jgi:hypothetical protein